MVEMQREFKSMLDFGRKNGKFVKPVALAVSYEDNALWVASCDLGIARQRWFASDGQRRISAEL